MAITAIEKIIYRAATCNMGNATEQDGENYRAWAKDQIEAKYPWVDVEVLDEDRGSMVDGDERMTDDDWNEAHEFLCELWYRCPWSGEHFEV